MKIEETKLIILYFVNNLFGKVLDNEFSYKVMLGGLK